MPLIAFLEQISKIDDENSAKTRFFNMLNSCECCVCLYFAFLKHFSKIDDENSAKTRFLACWKLATTAYAFICNSRANFKIYGENSAKTLFSACWTFANTVYAFICVSLAVFKYWRWKQCKNAFFGMLNICDCCICLYSRFLSSFQKLMMTTVQKRVFWHVEHLRLLHMPIFAFLKQF